MVSYLDLSGGTLTVTSTDSSPWVGAVGNPWVYLSAHECLSESDAWREIARRIEERGCQGGLCLEISELYDEGKLLAATSYSMRKRVRAHLAAMRPARRWWQRRQPEAPLYLDEIGVAGPRILAAYLLAEEAEGGY